MTFVVPFDGSRLSEAALARAGEFHGRFDESVVAVSIIPKRNAEFARTRAGLDADGSPEPDTVAAQLRSKATRIVPDTKFHYEVVGKYAQVSSIANRLRRVARQLDATMVFIGSENAGQVVNSLSSVGSSIAADTAYDVVIIRHSGA